MHQFLNSNKLTLVIYIFVCTLCVSALTAHLFIGINKNTYAARNNTHTNQKFSLTEQNKSSEEVKVFQEDTTTPRCPLVDDFGIGIVHWYYNANKNCYVALVFISESEARLALQDGTVIEEPFNNYLADRDTHLF